MRALLNTTVKPETLDWLEKRSAEEGDGIHRGIVIDKLVESEIKKSAEKTARG